MSNIPFSTRAAAPIALASLFTFLACASSAPKDPLGAAIDRNVNDTIDNDSGKSIESLLSGRFPGVTVTQAPGGGLQIRIRGGANTFSGNDEPLIVVDDVPLQGTRGIVYVNPYDIERIEVLKNPPDLTLYGMRGANGVIKITMKKPGAR
jgi:TonB-dependent SusC/RagA subfamily outer membrane receptor